MKRKQPTPPKRQLTASVAVLSAPGIQRGPHHRRGADAAWQKEAWSFYDLVGELRFASRWLSNAVSRCLLTAVLEQDGRDVPDVDGPAGALLADFAGGPSGQAELLSRIALQLSVAGDTYIVARETEEGDAWQAYSTEEIAYTSRQWKIDDGMESVTLAVDDLVIRCWMPHPRMRGEADSPVRSTLPVLRELHGLTQRVQAEIDSRLAGNGLLLLPSEMEFPQGQGVGESTEGQGDFVPTLIEYMTTAIRDRESAAGIVPLVATAPGEFIGNAKLIQFWSELDSRSKELREEAIRRFALAADMPPEIVLGLGDSTHWNAWAISEGSVTLHVEPLVQVVCHALTIGWLRPALAASGVADPSAYSVGFDSSPLRVKADRSDDARDIYDRGELSGEVLRRESGFNNNDAPTDEEIRRRLIIKILESSAPTSDLLAAIGINVTEDIPSPAELPAGDQVPEDGSAGAPGDGMPPEELTASLDPGSALASVEVCEMAVYRALELAGKRLLTRERRHSLSGVPAHLMHTHVPVPETDLDRLLDGAWSTLSLVRPDTLLTVTIDDYVRDLLRSGMAHQTSYLRSALLRADHQGLAA